MIRFATSASKPGTAAIVSIFTMTSISFCGVTGNIALLPHRNKAKSVSPSEWNLMPVLAYGAHDWWCLHRSRGCYSVASEVNSALSGWAVKLFLWVLKLLGTRHKKGQEL